MISQVLQHLDALQVDLSLIDPAHDTEAAEKVAAIASALRRAVKEASCDRGSEQRIRAGVRKDAA